MIIGITGGTGCGKTTALQAIEQLGGVVMDCDRIYHELLTQDTALLNAINTRFPGCVSKGILDRKHLAGVVFTDPAALQDLNAITHSAVKTEVLRRLANVPAGIPVAIDAIELFGGGLGELCDITVAITAPEEERLQRLIARDGITREQALQRLLAQKPESYFRQKCRYTLENTGTTTEFMDKCLVFFRDLTIIKENEKGE